MVKKIQCSCVGRDYSELLASLKTIADANRLRLICSLKCRESCVGELVEALGIPHNLASHHLKALKQAGLLASRRKGKYIYYKIDKKGLGRFLSQIKKAVGGNYNEK